jgi:hypothetical protein
MSSPASPYGNILNGVRALYADTPLIKYGQRAEDFGGAIGDKARGLMQRMGLMPEPDTGWHDQMVRDANAAFARQAQAAIKPNLTQMRKPLEGK